MAITFLSDLNSPPRPLINHDYKFILVFSAKSACTYSLAWYLNTLGLLEHALNYSNDLHRYRQEVINSKPIYQKCKDYKLLKIYRDPIDRASSSFRHYISSPPLHNQVLNLSGIDIMSEGLSIKEYIDFLNIQDLNKCDIHCKVQRHPVEAYYKNKTLINISKEKLHSELIKFEQSIGITTGFSHRQEYMNSKDRSFIKADPDEIYNTKMHYTQAVYGPWPREMIGKKAKERLKLLYRDDIV